MTDDEGHIDEIAVAAATRDSTQSHSHTPSLSATASPTTSQLGSTLSPTTKGNA